jgi:hypothetical protein
MLKVEAEESIDGYHVSMTLSSLSLAIGNRCSHLLRRGRLEHIFLGNGVGRMQREGNSRC